MSQQLYDSPVRPPPPVDLSLPSDPRERPASERDAPDELSLADAPPSPERIVALGFEALYADPEAARSSLESVLGLDRDGALRILAESPEAYGELQGPSTIGSALARVLADLPDREPAGGLEDDAPSDVRLEYDGRFLTLRNADAERVDRNGSQVASVRPDESGDFDLSASRQAQPGVGPTPEGEDHGHSDEVQQIGLIDRLGFRNWQGGTASWGEERVWGWPGASHTGPDDLHAEAVQAPIPGTDQTVSKDGFSIHGGDLPGTAGCIDLTTNDAAFFRDLADTRSQTGTVAPLYVNPETAGGPDLSQ